MAGTPVPSELKEQALKRLLPPYCWSLRKIAEEVGTSPSTILKWRKQLEAKGTLLPNTTENSEWSAEQIFTFVLETALMSEIELAEYCRSKGIYVDQIKQWKQSCINANTPETVKATEHQKKQRTDRKRIKELERELARKEKALAETAALLVLREKFNALWEENEDE